MGGRGGSYSYSPNVAKSVIGANGENIDLSDSPLKYGKKDPNLVGKSRATIEEFENKRYKNKIEYSRFVDANGNIIEENKGGKGSVKASLKARLNAETMSHNHPRSGKEAGQIGGTFSTGDLQNFVIFNQKTYRATASEGTYSISKLKNFDGKGLASYYASEHKKNYAKYEQTANNLINSVKSGKISYSEALKLSNKAFNSFLVSQHESLLAGQNKYGYYYTLERR